MDFGKSLSVLSHPHLFKTGNLNISKSVHSIALRFVEVVLNFLQVGMSKWAVHVEEPTAVIVSLQKQGRRTHQGILSRLMAEGNKRKTVMLWQGLGLSVDTHAKTLEDRVASQYMWSWRRVVRGPEKQFWKPVRRRRLNQKSNPSGAKRKTCGPLATGAKRRQCYQQEVSWGES